MIGKRRWNSDLHSTVCVFLAKRDVFALKWPILLFRRNATFVENLVQGKGEKSNVSMKWQQLLFGHIPTRITKFLSLRNKKNK